MLGYCMGLLFFFLNYTATTEIYTLSLHDALPIFDHADALENGLRALGALRALVAAQASRSEEHTSELQSHHEIVCGLLLEKKKKRKIRKKNRIGRKGREEEGKKKERK